MQKWNWRHLLLISLASLSLVACEPKPDFNTTDVSGAEFGPGLRLPDHNGQLRTLSDFRGKIVTVFFGYTNCPDVCPTSLALLQDVRRQLGPDGERVQVLFITVDPQRDTAERLKMYMNAFDPSFLGLVGSEAEVAIIAKEFKAFYAKHGDIAGGRYSVDHTAGSYIFDTQGRARLFARHGETASRVAADIKLLLAEK